jgi:hypothetical protein
VIKPALVGLLGPWISGASSSTGRSITGRPPICLVHASIERNADGSCTVWMSDHDPMLRMKGMVGICLSPGRAVVEARIRVYNRTTLQQTFL